MCGLEVARVFLSRFRFFLQHFSLWIGLSHRFILIASVIQEHHQEEEEEEEEEEGHYIITFMALWCWSEFYFLDIYPINLYNWVDGPC